MGEKLQGLTVIYGDDILRCQTCHCVEESNGNLICLNQCKHTHHVRCLVEHARVNGMVCPDCDAKYEDVRMTIAVALGGANS